MKKISFLSRVQSYFAASYHGRYLAYVLAEIGKHHPKIVARFVCQTLGLSARQLGRPTLDPEYVFQGAQGRRRADLAVFAEGDAKEPVALIEIKYLDKLLPATETKPAQLKDYQHWVRGGRGRKLMVLSREVLAPDGFCAVTWTQAGRLLRTDSARSDLVKSLVEHLEEEGIVMQNVDSKALVGFMKTLLAPNNAGRQAGNLAGPAEFGKLLHNVKLLSARFNPMFKEAWSLAGKKHNGENDPLGTKEASVNFDVHNYLKVPPKASLVEGDQNELRDAVRNGGALDVYARHALGSGADWLRVGYGFWITVPPRSSHKKGYHPSVQLYSWARGQWVSDSEQLSDGCSVKFDQITTKAEESIDVLDGAARKHLRTTLQALSSRSSQLTDKQITAIKHLIKCLQ